LGAVGIKICPNQPPPQKKFRGGAFSLQKGPGRGSAPVLWSCTAFTSIGASGMPRAGSIPGGQGFAGDPSPRMRPQPNRRTQKANCDNPWSKIDFAVSLTRRMQGRRLLADRFFNEPKIDGEILVAYMFNCFRGNNHLRFWISGGCLGGSRRLDMCLLFIEHLDI